MTREEGDFLDTEGWQQLKVQQAYQQELLSNQVRNVNNSAFGDADRMDQDHLIVCKKWARW